MQEHLTAPQEVLAALAGPGKTSWDAGNIVELVLSTDGDGEAPSVESHLAAE